VSTGSSRVAKAPARVRARAAGADVSAEARAEIVKLARLLGLDGADSLSYLRGVSAAELVAYREAVIEALYDEGRDQLQRAADAAKLLPARVLAKIGERAFGPLICARLAGLIDARRAAEIAEHFSIEFLAQLAAELDPRRAVDVLSLLPRDRVVAIALAMAARGEQVAMGRFVAHLDKRTLGECIEGLSDEDVLRVAFVAEGSRPQSRVFDAAGVVRIRGVIAAARGAGLGEEAEFFLHRLSPSQRGRVEAAAGV
jgi:hypothetical protein